MKKVLKMPKYPVNVSKLIRTLGPRTYSDQVCAGIREVIANAMDYEATEVDIQIKERNITITNNGKPLNPRDILNYVTIASDHQRESEMRGEFGWGHTALLGISKSADIITNWEEEEYAWSLGSTEYQPYVPKPSSETFGLRGIYRNIAEHISVRELKYFLRSRFSIPLYKKTLKIIVNGQELRSLLPADTVVRDIKTDYGSIRIYYTPKNLGKIYWCHKEVGVCEATFSGFLGFIDEAFLDLKLSKEGYIINKEYKEARKVIAKFLQTLIPQTAYREKVQQYIKGLMKLLRGAMPGYITGKRAEVDYSPRKKGETHGSNPHGLSSIEQKKREVKGIKGIVPVNKGLDYPFLWYDSEAMLLLLNQTHPITRDLVEKSESVRSVALHARLPLNRALLCIQLFDTGEETSWLQGEITRCDRETAKRLIARSKL